MTIVHLPKPATPKSAREPIVDPLPRSVLHQLVADIPGPGNETPTQRATRFAAQLAEVVSYNPRTTMEVMLATQCVLIRLVAEGARRDADRPSPNPAKLNPHLRSAWQMEKLLADTRRALRREQSRPVRPLTKIDPAMLASLGLRQFLIPDPDQAEEAFSAVIVPLHPAPKMLQ